MLPKEKKAHFGKRKGAQRVLQAEMCHTRTDDLFVIGNACIWPILHKLSGVLGGGAELALTRHLVIGRVRTARSKGGERAN